MLPKLRLFSLLFTIFLGLTVFISPTLADNGTAITSGNFKAAQNSDFSIINIQHALLCNLAGQSPIGKCVGIKYNPTKRSTSMLLYDQVPGGGAVGGIAMAMGSVMSTPPTSTVQYLADLGSNLGLVSPAYAQVEGSGSSVIQPVYKLWQAIRNLAYFAFIVVFMVVGLMIMFRSKVGGQNAVTIQASLPGLVMGLILVTFSYFIAAALVDTSFLGMQVVARLFDPATAGNNYFGDASRIQQYANTSSIFDLFRGAALRPQNISDVAGGVMNVFYGGGVVSVGSALVSTVTGVLGGILGFLVGGPIGAFAIGGAVAGPAIISGFLGLLVPIILIIALIVQLFRLLFELINSYIQILILTIAGPIYCLVAALPGRGSAMNNWWRCILANSLVFPAVFTAFMFAGLILGSNDTWQSTLPLFGGLGTALIKLLVAYGVILGTPAIPPMVRNALGCKGPQEYARAAMQGYMSGINITRGAATAGYNRMMAPMQAQQKAYQDAVARSRASGGVVAMPPVPLTPGAGRGLILGWGPLQGFLSRYVRRGTGT